jgi:hypothetical protein
VDARSDDRHAAAVSVTHQNDALQFNIRMTSASVIERYESESKLAGAIKNNDGDGYDLL